MSTVTTVMYIVSAWSDKGDFLWTSRRPDGHWGPFAAREDAEQCVAALARRSDIIAATVSEVGE